MGSNLKLPSKRHFVVVVDIINCLDTIQTKSPKVPGSRHSTTLETHRSYRSPTTTIPQYNHHQATSSSSNHYHYDLTIYCIVIFVSQSYLSDSIFVFHLQSNRRRKRNGSSSRAAPCSFETLCRYPTGSNGIATRDRTMQGTLQEPKK